MSDIPIFKPALYLAGPIQHATDKHVHPWRDHICAQHGHEFHILDPRAHGIMNDEIPTHYETIINHDLKMIDRCHVLLAYTPFPSVGTSMEIFYGYAVAFKDVVIWHPPDAPAVSPWVLAHADHIVDNLDEALAHARAMPLRQRQRTLIF